MGFTCDLAIQDRIDAASPAISEEGLMNAPALLPLRLAQDASRRQLASIVPIDRERALDIGLDDLR
jgi:hypothetical protein